MHGPAAPTDERRRLDPPLANVDVGQFIEQRGARPFCTNTGDRAEHPAGVVDPPYPDVAARQDQPVIRERIVAEAREIRVGEAAVLSARVRAFADAVGQPERVVIEVVIADVVENASRIRGRRNQQQEKYLLRHRLHRLVSAECLRMV